MGDLAKPVTVTPQLDPDGPGIEKVMAEAMGYGIRICTAWSVAAAGIAAHEVGHAIQHKEGYWPMKVRQKMVPVANIGTNLGMIMVVLGLIVGFAGLAKLGVLLFGGFVLFTLVTLPVEFDASRRAHRILVDGAMVRGEEAKGVASVLTAAAATYVASAVTAILQLVYFALRARVLGDD